MTGCGFRTQDARVKNGSQRGHAFFVRLLPFGQPGFGLCAARLDHGNTLGVHAVRLCLRRDQRPRLVLGAPAARLTGPYFELSYKASGKTVNVQLSPEAAPLYRAAAQQYHKLKTLLNRLDQLSKTILRHQAKLAGPNAGI